MREIHCALIASHADRGPVCAGHNVRAKTERFDDAHDVVDFGLARVGVHYNEHGRRLLTGNYTLRSNLTRVARFWPEQNGRQHTLDLGPVLLVLRRKPQSLTQMRRRFICRKTGPFGRDFKQNAARLAKVDRVEIEAIDDRRDVEAELLDLCSPLQLLLFVRATERNVIDRAGGIHSELSILALATAGPRSVPFR